MTCFSLENCEAQPLPTQLQSEEVLEPHPEPEELSFLQRRKNQFMRTPKTIQIMVIMSRDISYTIVSKQNMWTDVT